MKEFLVLLATLTLCTSQINYQERILYYSQQDNVCVVGWQSDVLHIDAYLPGTGWISLMTTGSTLCDSRARKFADAIKASDKVQYMNTPAQCRITFDQTQQKIYSSGNLYRLIAKTTIQNPILYAGRKYVCEINGDGKQQHFGINQPDQDQARITMKCEKQKIEFEKEAEKVERKGLEQEIKKERIEKLEWKQKQQKNLSFD